MLENLYLNPRAGGIAPFQPVCAAERRACRKALARFSVRPPDPTRPIATLSGGNQQKVVSRGGWKPMSAFLILEEPTIGVDVGSKAEIYRRFSGIAEPTTAAPCLWSPPISRKWRKYAIARWCSAAED